MGTYWAWQPVILAGMPRSTLTPPCVLEGDLTPYTITVAEARRLSGLSRSELYRRLGAGHFQAVKAGNRTLIILETLLAHLRSLPRATFQAPLGKRGD
jgi:hypothetical protein